MEDVLPALHEIWAATRRGQYAAGFVSYEAGPAFDAALHAHPPGDLPLLWFGVFGAPAKASAMADEAFSSGEWRSATSREVYDQDIAAIRAAIRRGDTYQVNYTVRLRSTFSGDPLAWYTHLRQQPHGRFNAYLDIGEWQIVSLSPELFFAWDGEKLTAKPMKGTAPRAAPSGRWPEEDQALAVQLLNSEKNRAENLMIVDLLRNDLARIAVTGSVKVPHLFSLEGYPTLYQLTSTVTAQTRPGATLADIFRALFPCGSITGAPKIKTTEIIAALEGAPRGVYCGAIGYVTPQGKAIFNVPIRTIVVDRARGAAECGVGGGITWDSTAADEYAEMLIKARFLNGEPFQLLETLLLHEGEYAFYERHLQRLKRSAEYFSFSFLPEDAAGALRLHAAEYPQATRRVRLLAASDGCVRVESTSGDATPIDWYTPPRNSAMEVALADAPIDSGNRFLYHKTTARAVYEQHSTVHPGAFDVLLWNEKGELTEFTRGNMVLELEGERLTPPLACGLLPGTLRAELLERGVIRETVLHRRDIERATGFWFINGVRGWVPVKLA